MVSIGRHSEGRTVMAAGLRGFALPAQVAIILVTSTVLGLAYNTLYPGGLLRLLPPAHPVNRLPAAATSAPAKVSGKTAAPRQRVVTAPRAAKQAVNAPAKPRSVTWPQVRQLMAEQELLLIDVRTKAAFSAGAIPGALSVPHSQFKREMPRLLRKCGRDVTIVVYCSHHGCTTSEQAAATLLREYGARNVLHMPGGYEEWCIAEHRRAPSPGRHR